MNDDLEIYKRKGYTVGTDGALHPPRRIPSSPKPEPPVRDVPLAEASGAKGNSPAYAVRVVSYRHRTLDTDNLVGGAKYFVDGLRHAGLIPDDRPQDITLEVSQVKIPTCRLEHTEITITTL